MLADVKPPRADTPKTEPCIKRHRTIVAAVDTQQQTGRASFSGMTFGFNHQLPADSSSVKLMEKVDSFHFEIAITRVLHGQRGGRENEVPDRRAGRIGLCEPHTCVAVEPRPVDRRRVLFAAMRDDIGAGKNAGKRFEKRRLPHQGKRILVTRPAEADACDVAQGLLRMRAGLAIPRQNLGDYSRSLSGCKRCICRRVCHRQVSCKARPMADGREHYASVGCDWRVARRTHRPTTLSPQVAQAIVPGRVPFHRRSELCAAVLVLVVLESIQ